MKTLSLLALMSLVCTGALAAETVALNSQSTSLYPAQVISTRVTTLMPRCPAGAMCDPSSFATVTVGLGCLDRLGPVTSQTSYDRQDGKLDIYVTALGIADRRSQTARCIRQNTASFQIHLGMGFYSDESVRFHFSAPAPYAIPARSMGVSPARLVSAQVRTVASRGGALSSAADLVLGLGGCVDRLGPVSVERVRNRADGKLDVYLTALTVANADSMRVRCIAEPLKRISVSLGQGVQTNGSVRFHFAERLLDTTRR